jgi:crotonobetainyl-CoA:carnitine CoA-transferase CaiB-like acyl-CoA transferase
MGSAGLAKLPHFNVAGVGCVPVEDKEVMVLCVFDLQEWAEDTRLIPELCAAVLFAENKIRAAWHTQDDGLDENEST